VYAASGLSVVTVWIRGGSDAQSGYTPQPCNMRFLTVHLSRHRVPVAPTLFLCLLASQASILVLSPLLPQIARDFGVDTGTAGQLRAVSGLVAGAGAFGVRRFGGRTGLRNLLLVGSVLLMVAAVAGSAAPTFQLLAVAQVLAGVGIAIVLTGAVAASAQWPPPEQRMSALSWALVGQPVAWVIGMPIVGILAEGGWRLAWAALPSATALAAYLAVRTRPEDQYADGLAEKREVPVRGGHHVIVWALGELLAFSAWTGALVYSGAVFASYGASSGTVGFLLGLGAVAYIPGNFVARRLVRSSARLPAAVLAVGLAVGVFAFAGMRPSLVGSSFLFASLAAVAGARTFAASALGLELSPSAPLSVTGIRSAANQFGYLIGAGLGGLALSITGFAGFAIGMSACAMLAAALHLSAVLDRYRITTKRPIRTAEEAN
jgi:MFS transporter, DHA1 family, inner membrane transport protein